MSKAPCIAVLGTGSDVGKSIITAGLCRIFKQKGFKVAPFKAQNMSNNSGVTPDGLEMGRAQIVQAEACGIAPHVDMNPVLLKPVTDVGSQVVVLGKVMGNNTAMEYYEKKEMLQRIAFSALNRLRDAYDLIIIEGAGSCAEVNLFRHDFVNMRTAEYADAPVILVGDIHRGGIFAQLVGTLACLPNPYAERIKGFLINRFRGDIRLFDEGCTYIEEKTGKKVFGVIPHLCQLGIEDEDSVAIETPEKTISSGEKKDGIAIIRLPHIANFSDFTPLTAALPGRVHYIESPISLEGFKAVILPGSKNTRHDMTWLFQSGWREEILAFYNDGGHILGICGGYQMLGERIHDPDGLEGPSGESAGLSLLPVKTVLKAPKVTTRTLFSFDGTIGMGYEIHMGETRKKKGPFLVSVLERNGEKTVDKDGARDETGHVLGTYLHGFFDNAGVLEKWLGHIGIDDGILPSKGKWKEKNARYDRLAEHLLAHLHFSKINDLINNRG